MEFDWSLKKTWEGYLNPHHRVCPDCDGSGQSAARLRLEELARLILLSGSDTARQKPHPYFSDTRALHHTYGMVVSGDMLELTNALSERDGREMFGYDSGACGRTTKKIISAAGLDPETWGICKTCEGRGEDPAAAREASEGWARTEPPAGEGWQMWETTSEGSPISPVFATPEELARWLAGTGASSFGSDTATYEQWLRMIKVPGWAPGAVIIGGAAMSGVEGM